MEGWRQGWGDQHPQHSSPRSAGSEEVAPSMHVCRNRGTHAMVSRLPAHELRACIAAPCARTSCIILVQHVRPCTQHKPKYLHATQGPRKFSVGQYDYRQSFILRKCEPLQCVEQNVVRHLQQTLIQFGSAASSTHTLAFCSTNHSTTFTQPLAAASCTALLYTYEIKVNLVQHDQLPVNLSLTLHILQTHCSLTQCTV